MQRSGLERFSLAGKHAVVVGGTSGIGQAIAVGLAEAGAAVTVAGRNANRGGDVCQAIRAKGSESVFVPVDVTDLASVEALAAQSRQQMGRVDILVNSAGLNLARRPALELTDEIWQQTMDANFMGAWRCARAFGRQMVEAGGGKIIQITSLSHVVTYHNVGPYAASKAAMAQLTRSLAMEWAPHGVYVNSLCPGRIATPLIAEVMKNPEQVELMHQRIPLRRVGEPEDLIGPTIFLASDASNYMTGVTLIVDGGWSIAS